MSEIPQLIDELKDLKEIYSSKAAAYHFTSNLPELKTEEVIPVDIERATAGFSSEFQDRKHALKHYVDYVRNEIFEKYRKEESKRRYYYALYFAVTQSSGYGKSRIMLEAGKKDLNTVYGCIRADNNSGYPLPNTDLLNFLKTHNTVPELIRFLCFCYLVSLDYVKKNYKPENEYLPLSNLFKDSPSQPFDGFWQQVIKCCNDKEKYSNHLELFKKSQFEFKKLKNKTKPKGGLLNGKVLTELVVILDEAKSLLNRNKANPMDDGSDSIFRNLRRALRQMKSRNMVVIFTDTLSTISNFSPASSFDSSFRPESQFNLLPPYNEVLTYDALRILDYNDDFDDYSHYYAVFSQGRPLWAALFLQDVEDENAVNELIFFARQKLSNSAEAELKKDLAVIAVLAVRCGISGVLDHHLGSALMSSFMGTGIYIDDDRVRMVVQYPPEPALGEAACQSLYSCSIDTDKPLKFDAKRMQEILCTFITKCVTGLVSAGTIGEVISRSILSLTYDQVVLNRIQRAVPSESNHKLLFTYPIPLAEFLKKLFPKAYKKQFSLRFHVDPPVLSDEFMKTFGTGMISFTAWMALQNFCKHMDEEEWQFLLGECFSKRVAIIMPLNFKGVDLIIPVKFGTVYSCIMIQVKNRVEMKSDRLQVAGNNLTPTHCFGRDFFAKLNFENTTSGLAGNTSIKPFPVPQYLGLYMEIGPDQLNASFESIEVDSMIEFVDKYPSHIMMLGFESARISSIPELSELFNLFCRRQMENVNLSERVVELQGMNPLAYLYSETSCNCKGECANRRCGCYRIEKGCTKSCFCMLADKCENPLTVPRNTVLPTQTPLEKTKSESKVSDKTAKRAAPSKNTEQPEAKKAARDASMMGKPRSATLFVGGLSFDVDKYWLNQEFSSCAGLTNARVITDRKSGRSRGFGYVEFDSSDNAQAALDKMNGTAINGRRIRLDFAQARQSEGAASGGGYGGNRDGRGGNYGGS